MLGTLIRRRIRAFLKTGEGRETIHFCRRLRTPLSTLTSENPKSKI